MVIEGATHQKKRAILLRRSPEHKYLILANFSNELSRFRSNAGPINYSAAGILGALLPRICTFVFQNRNSCATYTETLIPLR